MAQIYKLFSTEEALPQGHTLDSANRALHLIRKYTEEAISQSEKIASKLAYFPKNSNQYKALSKQYDQEVMRWVERVHRMGGQAKGLWLVDFDTGSGYLCWAYPEERVEHFHDYQSGFKARKRVPFEQTDQSEGSEA